MSTTAMPSNGKVQRKQLADQLDRLDEILDLMAEGLPAAVADACREGTRLAVKDAVVQFLTDPELRATLASQVPAPATPDVTPEAKKPSIWNRLKAKVAAARAAAVAVAATVKAAVVAKVAVVTTTVAAAGVAAGEPLPVRRAVGAALGVGLAVALVCAHVPEAVAAAVAGAGAAATTACVQAGAWLRRAARRVGLLR